MNNLKTKIDNYKQSTFQLADLLYQMKLKHGRKNVLEMTGLDLAKLNWFCAIGSFIDKHHNLMPEHYVEIIGLSKSDVEKYLTLAIKNNLSPCHLRKVIRADVKTVPKKQVSSPIKVNQFSKHLLSLQSEMGKMDNSQRLRAKEMLKNL